LPIDVHCFTTIFLKFIYKFYLFRPHPSVKLFMKTSSQEPKSQF